MKKMILTAVVALGAVCMMPAMAQSRRDIDPKQASARMAEKLNFTDAQMAQLKDLNARYPGTDFDKMKYRDEFRSIMTKEQKKQADEMRAEAKKQYGKGHKGHH